MITVIGKLADIERYRNVTGYNVMARRDDWTPERNRSWLDEAIARGDQFLIASSDYSGEFLNELIYLLRRITGGAGAYQVTATQGFERKK